MFNSSQIIIPRGTFNVVNRDQYNITYNDYLQPDALPRFSPEDRWKTELYQEYNLVRTGDVNLLETIYENAATEYEYEDGKWAERKATRVVSVAHLGNGWGRTRFLSVQYTGPDARKIFKTDCLTFSRIKHVNIVQLHAFNDSKNGPMLFFHDELIPLAHVIQNHPGCRYALERYIALQDALMFPEPPFNKSWTQVWIRAKDGTFVYGPDGPSFDVNHLDFSVSISHYPHQHPLPALTLNLYNHQTLVNHLASWLLGEFIPSRGDFKLRRQSLPTGPHLAVLSASSTFPHVIARFPETGAGAPWKLRYPGKNDYTLLMDDGRIRFRVNKWSDGYRPCVRLYLDSVYRREVALIWSAQAFHVFTALNVSRHDWDDYGYVYSVDLDLVEVTQKRQFSCFNDRNHNEINFPYYLFVRPCLQFPDSSPNIANRTSGADLYYWSTDSDGHSEMTEEERVTHNLPSYFPKVTKSWIRTWELEEYDFMRDVQEAKGFDPTATDYARSLGIPVLKVVYPGDDQFESLPEEDDLESYGDPMMEMEPLLDGGICESSSPVRGTVRDLDIEMEDICMLAEPLDVDVDAEMETDD